MSPADLIDAETPQQAIDSAINRAQELRQIPSEGGNVQL
jgi:hypothetical protein